MRITRKQRNLKAMIALFGALCLGLVGSTTMVGAQEATPNPTPKVEATRSPKDWSSGSVIGTKLDGAGNFNGNDGRMISPQNQTQSPFSPTRVIAKAGTTLSCSVETATDMDHWRQPDNDDDSSNDNNYGEDYGDSGDGVNYTWNCTGGGFPTETVFPGASATWTAPMTPGRYILSCVIDDTPTPVDSPETGSREDASVIRSVEVYVYTVEMEINNTPATNDDVVRIKDDPNRRHYVNCRVRVVSSPKDVTVVLVNPDGKLRLPGTADTTKTRILPKSGEWVSFGISGESQSAASGDAKIEAHMDSAAGKLLAQSSVSVFWFENPNISVAVGGQYRQNDYRPGTAVGSINYDAFLYGNQHGVDLAAWATIKPSGLDCSVPQIANCRIGIVQNILDLKYSATWFNSVDSGISWNEPTATQLAPLTITFPTDLVNSTQFPVGTYLDTVQGTQIPLYDSSSNALAIPFGCVGGGTARAFDTPQIQDLGLQLTQVPYFKNGQLVAYRNYDLDKASIAASFLTWAVCYDSNETYVTPLRQRPWSLNINSSMPQSSQVASIGADASPTDPVVGGTLANTVLIDPNNQSISEQGQPITYTHP